MIWLLILLILECFLVNRLTVSFHSIHPKVGIVRPKPLRIPLRTTQTTTKLYGIPKLFRWLVDLYPPVVDSIEKADLNVDNFYLDMNGIIHPCTHANDGKLVKLDEQQMFLRIFLYTDRLYKLIKPKKLLYLAVDGVAPRAKMNQQRSRRYRAGKEREAIIADYVEREGKNSKMISKSSFDSNCITPGTDFMYRLGIAFRRWIDYKMKHDPFWINNGAEQIVFSGCDIPGEGEHKIMDRIRLDQARDPTYRGQQLRHCMYGLDADLIMLSLVSHEPNFVLLREKVLPASASKKDALDLTPEDFEVLEISSVRGMLKKFYHTLGKPTAAASSTPPSPPSMNNRPVTIPSVNGEAHLMDSWRTEGPDGKKLDMNALINAGRNVFEGKNHTQLNAAQNISSNQNQTRQVTPVDVRRTPKLSKIEQMRFEMQEMSATAQRDNHKLSQQPFRGVPHGVQYPAKDTAVLTPSTDPLADKSIDFERVIDDFVFMLVIIEFLIFADRILLMFLFFVGAFLLEMISFLVYLIW
jgi:hypothetical protein